MPARVLQRPGIGLIVPALKAVEVFYSCRTAITSAQVRLGLDASPNNPIGAYLPATDILDPARPAIACIPLTWGTLTISKNGGSDPTFDTIGGLPLGAYLVAFCAGSSPGGDCTVGGKHSTTEVATANSGALLENGNVIVPVPEPGTLALFAATLLLLGCTVGDGPTRAWL